MTTTYTVEQMIAIGGSRWTKAGYDRVYLDDAIVHPMIGLEIERYKSGNISWAALNGDKISNTKAGRIVGKVFLSVATGHIVIQGFEGFESQILAGVAKLVSDTTEPATAESADVAELVRGLRAGRTVRQVAEMLGVSAPTIYRWSARICRPRPANLARLVEMAGGAA